MPKTRIEAFSDGVLAIVITLLAFDLKLGASAPSLSVALDAMWPKINAYILSFAMVGIFWVGHHNIFHVFRRIDRNLIWMNLLFLLLTTFLPFTTSTIGAWGADRLAVILYGANLASLSLVMLLMWVYATRRAGLADPGFPPETYGIVDRMLLMMPLLAAASIGLSFLAPRHSLEVYYLIVVRFFFARRLEKTAFKEH